MTGGLRFRSVRQGDEEVLAALEAMVEPTPWTVGDFADVLRNGWFCDVLELDDGSIGAWATRAESPPEPTRFLSARAYFSRSNTAE